jgi:hypothetical protein
MSRVVCIVGMHRSGTSCLAGSLEEAGLHLGNVITSAPHNAKGNRENKRIMDLHESVLVHSGGRWDAPPSTISWTAEHARERDSVVEGYGGADFGFKCPRTLFLLGFWQEVVSTPVYVGTFRHPVLVAESLLRRNGGTLEGWIDLWAAYNERLLALHERIPFPVVRFDVEAAEYADSLARVALELGLSPPSRLTFFEPTLRHERAAADLNLPRRAAALYDRLCLLSGTER